MSFITVKTPTTSETIFYYYSICCTQSKGKKGKKGSKGVEGNMLKDLKSEYHYNYWTRVTNIMIGKHFNSLLM